MQQVHRLTTHATMALAEAGIISLILVVLIVAPALGAKGGGRPPSPSASVSVTDAAFGGVATATVAGASGLYVRVECFADGGVAMLAVERTDSGGSAWFQMGPTASWESGAADCTAQAGHFDRRGRWLVDASTTFHVAPA